MVVGVKPLHQELDPVVKKNIAKERNGLLQRNILDFNENLKNKQERNKYNLLYNTIKQESLNEASFLSDALSFSNDKAERFTEGYDEVKQDR